MPASDNSLLRSYAQLRTETSFAALVERHVNLVHSIALRSLGGDAHLAEDVTQEVFVALARNAKKLTEHPALSAWLFRTTRNVAAHRVRSERRRKQREKESSLMEQISQITPDLDWKRLGPLLDELIEELNEGDRRAVLMRFMERRIFAEIGSVLHLTEDAARMKVERALDKLRSLLARRGITSSSAALVGLLTNQALATAPAGLAANVTAAAITAASVSPGPALGFFALMNSTKLVTGVCGAIVVLALGSAVHFSQRARLADERVLTAEKDRDEARAVAAKLVSAASLENRRSPEASPTDGLFRPTEVGSPIAPRPIENPLAGISISGMQSSNPIAALWSLRSSPEAMRAWLEAERSGLQLQLGPLFEKLNLPAPQVEQVKQALMEKYQTIADVLIAGASTGTPPADPVIKELIKETSAKTENRLHDLLGDKGYAELRQFGETLNVRELLRSLASDTYYTATPLNAAQSERMIQIIAEQSVRDSSGYDLRTTQWENVFAEGRGTLTTAQIAVLRAEYEQLRLKQRLTEIEQAAKASRRP